MHYLFKRSLGFILIGSLLFLCNACSTKKAITAPIMETSQVNIPSLQVSDLFMDHMVLQQKDHVAFFGSADKHKIITVTGSWGEHAKTFSDDEGKWLAKINTPSAGGPFTVNISEEDQSIQINDILIGEVWLASGQSNMQMPVKGWPPSDIINNSAEEIANANFPQIRMLTVERSIASAPKEDFSGKWIVASPETAADFSATAYFFARRLHQELNVPVGIIHTSWGGTVAEAWTSKEKLLPLGDFDEPISILSDPNAEKSTEKWFSDKVSKAVPSSADGFAALVLNDENASTTMSEGVQEMSLPGRFDIVGDGEMDGAFWMYKEVMIEDPNQDYVLEFGAIDDIDVSYINGQRIGAVTGYNVKRSYNIPKSVIKKGKNLIAVRAIDTGGPGLVSEPMQLSSTNSKSISLGGTWLSVPAAEIYGGQFYIYDMNEDISKMRPRIMQQNPNIPTVLYNAMIHPLIPYSIKGAIWYQGESNVGRDQQYRKLFPSLISDWRQRWGNSFPFYFVQIAPFQYGGVNDDQSQKLREAQRKTTQLKNTGMVVTMDIGNNTNIHPSNKQDVGKRLAGLALAHDYGRTIVASGPNYKSKTIEGNSIVVEFDDVGSGLKAGVEGLNGFEIASRNGMFKPALAKIEGNQVIVHSADVTDPFHVRYAWSDIGVATLFNLEGLPASSFSSKN